MNCPKCGSDQNKVTWSHDEGNHVKRRRRCLSCDYRFNTVEIAGSLIHNMRDIATSMESFKRNGRIVVSMSQTSELMHYVESLLLELDKLPDIPVKNDKVYKSKN